MCEEGSTYLYQYRSINSMTDTVEISNWFSSKLWKFLTKGLLSTAHVAQKNERNKSCKENL